MSAARTPFCAISMIFFLANPNSASGSPLSQCPVRTLIIGVVKRVDLLPAPSAYFAKADKMGLVYSRLQSIIPRGTRGWKKREYSGSRLAFIHEGNR